MKAYQQVCDLKLPRRTGLALLAERSDGARFSDATSFALNTSLARNPRITLQERGADLLELRNTDHTVQNSKLHSQAP